MLKVTFVARPCCAARRHSTIIAVGERAVGVLISTAIHATAMLTLIIYIRTFTPHVDTSAAAIEDDENVPATSQ